MMLGLRRPPEPGDFARHVAAAALAVNEAVSRGGKIEFDPCWNAYKTNFQIAQHRKCGYCDAKLTEVGQIDHYRPKDRIQVLSDDPAEWGSEIPGGLSVDRPRKARVVADAGYHWLAYVWSNYVLSCERCNVGYKRSLFPVAVTLRAVPPDREAMPAETPLLLNPFDAHADPVRHLEYDTNGQVWPRADSDAGFETIRTVHLQRESLRDRREEKALKAHALVNRLAQDPDANRGELLAELAKMGRPEKEFAGMVRSIFEVETQHLWADIFPDL